ncbi:MAG: tetratricopeptide repeat protein [Pseudomonadota bacterium]
MFGLAILLILNGCGDRDATQAVEFGKAATLRELPDPCILALSPHQGSDATDLNIRHYQTLAANTPDVTAQLERLGWAYVAKARASFDPGYYKLAEATALCLESKIPGSLDALLLRGHALHNMHRFDDAERLARQSVSGRGSWFDYALLGDVLADKGRLSEAVEAYQTMMDQRPGPEAYNRAANLRWLKGDLDGAIELMRLSVSAGGVDHEAAAWALVRLAGYEFQAQNSDRALSLVNQALARRTDYPPARLLQGKILLDRHQYDDALACLQTAARLNPLPEFLWTLIEALIAAGKHDEATNVEAQIMTRGEIDDQRTFVLYLATNGLEVERAVKLAKEELIIRQDVFTLDAMAWSLRAAGQINQAYDFSRSALAEGTRDARLFYHAGVIANELGHDDEAGKLLAAAADLRHLLFPSERSALDNFLSARQAQKPHLAATAPALH